ncbi:L,D-transpeptidase [Leekyejoonella antrihumi]|uniref:L,D-transpeptidase n=1 Tax=Leekyejoonella antrihumi TaxID=1660198 RepID=UPI00164911E2|nr:L,D-transpeptidase [Leekyejoonella antrihumi]
MPKVTAAQLRALPVADTYARLRHAGIDVHAEPTGQLAHIARDTVAFRAPGGTPVAMIPHEEVGVATWLPVLAVRPGWLEVRLPSRPNGVVAWVPAPGIPTKSTSYRIVVSLHAGVMTIYRGRHVVGGWIVGHGRPGLPTPTARTFVMTRFHDPKQSFSPVIFALGAHSDAMASFEGGPGTIAIHGWPTYAGRHGGVSHGCVRVPGGALDALRNVPNGTPVDIKN